MIDEIKIKFLKSQLQKNGKLSVKINGECMVPFINENEIVMVKSVSKKISLGDVVMLYIDGNFKIHRIIKIDYTNRKVCTKGDNSVKVDSTKKIEEILGVVYRRKEYSIICQIYILLITYLSRKVAIIFNKQISKDRNRCLNKINKINTSRKKITKKLLNVKNFTV